MLTEYRRTPRRTYIILASLGAWLVIVSLVVLVIIAEQLTRIWNDRTTLCASEKTGPYGTKREKSMKKAIS